MAAPLPRGSFSREVRLGAGPRRWTGQVSNGVPSGSLRVRLDAPLVQIATSWSRVGEQGGWLVGSVSTAFSRRRLLLAGLWLTAAAAEWAALRPVIFQEHVRPEVVLYHVVGGSFAACGLLAWHRRPQSRTGPLMVVTGLLFFVHGTLGRLHSSFAETIGIAVSNYWVITFAALLIWFPGGRRRWAASERLVIGAFVVAEVVLALAWMLFAEIPRNLAVVWPNAQIASSLDRAASSLGFATSVCLAILLV